MIPSDSLSKVLYVDMNKNKYEVKDRSDLFEKYIGGAGVASHLLMEECPEGVDPLSPDNPIILAVGPLTGSFPLASKTVAMFKSPLTGNLGESHAGGRSAIAIRMAGFGAIVIKGRSELPVYLSIQDGKVKFKNATTLWGMEDAFLPARAMRQKEGGSGLRAILRIGRAGENMVSYAAVTTETYRHFGRTGMGAVFGSKHLKGIVISGKKSIEVANKREYRSLYEDIYKTAVNSSAMKKYHDLGTAGNIMTLNYIKALPIKNLQQSSAKGMEDISGEEIAKNHLGRRVACAHCPVACIHLANLRELYEDEPYFYKTTPVGYDFELIYALGTMLGIVDSHDLLRLIDEVEQAGVDSMSIGVVMAWATEMLEKNMIGEEELMDIRPEFGKVEEYIKLVNAIVEQPNDFYKALAKGSAYASEIYGGKEFAMAFGKNEMAGYHTGPAGYLGFLLGARHSHLDNGGYSIDQKELVKQEVTPQQVVDKLFEEEGIRQILSSIAVCFFARGIYDMDRVSKALVVHGFDFTPEQLSEIGKQVYYNKYKFKMREGFSFDDLHIPSRIYETEDPTGKITEEYIRAGLQYAKEKMFS